MHHSGTLRRMKTIRLTLLALIGCAVSSFGGEIFGTISQGSKAAGAGLDVEIKSATKAYPKVKTDALGRYHVYVAELGPCTLTVYFDNHQTDPFDIESYSTSVRFDLAVENKNGTYILRRR